jgi:hypothetical protein
MLAGKQPNKNYVIEAVALALGIACVLNVRQNMWCWPTGLVQVVLYIEIFYDARLYSDMQEWTMNELERLGIHCTEVRRSVAERAETVMVALTRMQAITQLQVAPLQKY